MPVVRREDVLSMKIIYRTDEAEMHYLSSIFPKSHIRQSPSIIVDRVLAISIVI